MKRRQPYRLAVRLTTSDTWQRYAYTRRDRRDRLAAAARASGLHVRTWDVCELPGCDEAAVSPAAVR